MTKEEFETMVAQYGASPHRWPADMAGRARDFMASNTDTADRLLKSERALDALLDMANVPNVENQLLRARILRTARQTSAANTGTEAHQTYKRPAYWRALAATILLTTGIGFGLGQAAVTHAQSDTGEALLMASLNADYSADDFLESDLTKSK